MRDLPDKTHCHLNANLVARWRLVIFVQAIKLARLSRAIWTCNGRSNRSKTRRLFALSLIADAYNQWITVRVRVGQVDADLRYINIDNFLDIDNVVVDSGWTLV